MKSQRRFGIDRSAMRSLKIASDLGTAVLLVFVLYAARDVLIPIALSALLAFLMSPIVNWFQKKGLSNIAAVFVTATGLFGILVVGLVLLGSSVAEFASDFPKYKGEIVKKVETVNSTVRSLGNRVDELMKSATNSNSEVSEGSRSDEDKAESDTQDSREEKDSRSGPAVDTPLASMATESNRNENSSDRLQGDRTNQERKSGEQFGRVPWQIFLGNLASVFGPIGTAGLVAVFALFMLVNRDDLRDRFVSVISRGNYVVTTEAIAEASDRISRYIVAQFLLNTSYGLIFGIGLWLIGIFLEPDRGFPNVLFFGAISGLVRFLPYVGPLIGAGLPLLVSVALFPGYSVFLGVLVLIIVMELLSNNVVEPWLYGSRTGVSAIAVITAAVFWGWLWGAVGLLLATPLTVCLVVLGRYVPRLKFFVTMLSDEEQVPPSLRSYQRLLANDDHKLRETLVEQAKKKEPVEFMDDVIVPLAKRVMRQPNTERPSSSELTQRLQNVLEEDSIRALFKPPKPEDAPGGNRSHESPAPSDNVKPLILAVGSRTAIEETLLREFERIVTNVRWHTMEVGELPEASVKEIVGIRPDAVLVLSMPPGGVRQTKFWCSALRSEGFDREIIVLRPARFKHFDELLITLRKSGANSLCTSFAQAERRLGSVRSSTSLAQPHAIAR